jgi:hypothetical protein
LPESPATGSFGTRWAWRDIGLVLTLDVVLGGSFPADGENDKVTIRQLFKESLSYDSMGLNSRLKDDEIRFSYPIALLKSTTEG